MNWVSACRGPGVEFATGCCVGACKVLTLGDDNQLADRFFVRNVDGHGRTGPHLGPSTRMRKDITKMNLKD